MKLHRFGNKIIIFFLMALVPVLMPLFYVNSTQAVNFDIFPLQTLYLALFSFILIFCNPELRNNKENEIPEPVHILILRFLFWGVLSLIMLLCVSYLLQLAGTLITKKRDINISKPETIKGWIFCCLNFLLSSFYEETVYRFFLPEAMIFFTRNVKDRKMAEIDCEIIAMILFAVGHIYLGFISVLNAAIAYIILRLCFRKTKSLVPGTAAHFLYNLIQLVISPL